MRPDRNPRTAVAALLALALIAFGAPASAQDDSGLPGLDGSRLTTETLSRGQTIVVFWASWSPKSRDLGPRVREMAEKWGKRARVLTVNFQEDPEKARTFARQQGLAVPVYLDREAVFAKRYAVTSLPFLLVLDDGETAFAGRLPADPDTVIGRALD